MATMFTAMSTRMDGAERARPTPRPAEREQAPVPAGDECDHGEDERELDDRADAESPSGRRRSWEAVRLRFAPPS